MMNITDAITQMAETLGLDCMATGGGFDYVYKNLAHGKQAIIADNEDAGSPDNLQDPCRMVIYDSAEWGDANWIDIPFSSAVVAMGTLAGMEPAKKVTFDDFIASRRVVRSLRHSLGDEAYEDVPGLVYLDGYYIKMNTDVGAHVYWMNIIQAEYSSDDLRYMEQKLWDTFVRDEVNH